MAIPGQEPGAADLPKDFIFPKMKVSLNSLNNTLHYIIQDLGLHLVSILDFLRIKQVVGLGDGAGANIITR